ncbi:MAG: DUF2970 domain-containing protein [Gammaproteobacteria bacterium]
MSKPTILQVIKSVLAAATGIQSKENREKDFEHGTLSNYIIGGLVFTVIFVLLITFLVSKVTGN